jgi:type IV pilus assembly protein PilB
MVGEIRDAETAGIAINTALTGHLVLSSLHTNDAATTLPRLLDMKIEPYLIASTVNIAIGQRLVRKICDHCKVEINMSAIELKSLNAMLSKHSFKATTSVFRGKGCEACSATGYFGRIGIHEVLVPDNAIRDAVLNKAPASEIQRLAIQQGMTTIIEDGLLKVKAGQTTLEEILRMQYE